MNEPSAFFSLLASFAEDLEAAHRENVAADEAAAKKAQQPVGWLKEGEQVQVLEWAD